MKGVKGYQGGHDLNEVILAGDLDIATTAPRGFGDTWIHGSLSAIASCKVLARTNEGNIRLSFAQDPGTGLSVIGRADEGTVLLGINVDGTTPPTSQARTELRERTKGYEGKQVQVEVTATSALSNVTILRYE